MFVKIYLYFWGYFLPLLESNSEEADKEMREREEYYMQQRSLVQHRNFDLMKIQKIKVIAIRLEGNMNVQSGLKWTQASP